MNPNEMKNSEIRKQIKSLKNEERLLDANIRRQQQDLSSNTPVNIMAGNYTHDSRKPFFVDKAINSNPMNFSWFRKIKTKQIIEEAYGNIPHHHPIIDNKNVIVSEGDFVDTPVIPEG